jgi:tetratricopeptide (TPR) repeat protein
MIYANWARALAETGQLAAARRLYAQALSVDPASPLLLRDAARVDLQLGDAAAADAKLRRAAELDEGDVEARYLLACAAILLGRAGEGDALLQDAATRDVHEAVVAIQLARSLARTQRDEDARRLFDALFRVEPPDPADARILASTLHAHTGEMAVERGDAAGAIAALERAVETWPDNYDATHRLAFLLAASSDPALRDARRALALAERAVAARRELGSLSTLAAAYAASSRFAEAVAAVSEAQELAAKADDPRADAALEHQLELYTQARDGITAARP